MPVEIRVGLPVIHISQGRTFMVTNRHGEIEADTEQGVYAHDTRFISFYSMYINRHPLRLVNSSQLSFYAARYNLTNPAVALQGGKIAEHTIRFSITSMVSGGIHEDIDVANYTGREIRFILEVGMRSDFADLFEVKAKHIVHRGNVQTAWSAQEKQLRTTYDYKDFHRAVIYRVLNDVTVGYANGRVSFDITLQPSQVWRTCTEMLLEHGQHIEQPGKNICSQKLSTASSRTRSEQKQETSGDFNELQAHWQTHCTNIVTSNNTLYRMYHQAVKDMGALRIYDMDVSKDAWVPSAGVPWYVTLFGRDCLTVCYQNMSVSAGFALGALKRLAEHQGREHNDWREEQPGKILHELRFGELAHFGFIPFTPYYGTADATILYLIVLSEAYRWTGDRSLLTDYREVAEKCLYWIDHYGDLDGDGFQEYKAFSSYRYENLGWKDASDAVVYADGSQVKQPKGLCELQGYVYDAKTRMAEIFDELEDHQQAQTLRMQAEELKRKFNQVFWMEEKDCIAFGLDPDKKQITSIASNAGQCLWSGIVDYDKAERTARRLLQDDMWSGWGIRTLSSENPAYNPLSYQLGSVWPQDNGIIAAGFKRYGLTDEANFIIHGVFAAIERFDQYRPPELFAGVKRSGEVDFPTLYPDGANIPQAWATGSIFHMLRTILGLRADAPHQKLYVHPTLSDWLPDIELQRMRIGHCSLTIRFWREGNASRWEVRSIDTDPGIPKKDMIQVLDDPDVVSHKKVGS
jgi:glycogen debranching enzyme